MLSRRDFLKTTAAVSAGALIRGGETALAIASQPSTPVNFEVPAGACDSHTHIFGDMHRFPLMVPRGYTPEPASVAESRAMHRTLRTERIVFIQPSVYGPDNSCMLDAIKRFGPVARGIAVIDDKTSESALDEMERGGIRGMRLNFEDAVGQTEPDVCRPIFQATVARMKSRPNWHIQLHTRLSVIEGLKDQLMAAPMPIVVDHFGEMRTKLGLGQPGFDTLLNLVRAGKTYVKITAPYHCSTEEPAFSDVAPFAKALVAANPQRILWGTDWPHSTNVQPKYTDISPLRKIDDGLLLNQLAIWVPDAAVRKMILVDNPARIFKF